MDQNSSFILDGVYMELQKYISKLLFRYDCVIVPDFCGFVRNPATARWDSSKKNQLHPPKNVLSINTHLKHNDGLLIQFLAEELTFPYEVALKKTYTTVCNWKRILNEEKKLVLDGIGVIEKNDNDQWDFTPSFAQNYYLPSFGLKPILTEKIVRVPVKENNIGVPFLRYTAMIVPIVGLLLFGYFFYTNMYKTTSNKAGFLYMDGHDKKTIEISEPLKNVISSDHKHFFSTSEESNQVNAYFLGRPFLFSNALEAEKKTSEVEKDFSDKVLIKKYQVIAGAFAKQKNAIKLRSRLARKGFNVQIVGKSGQLTLVAFDSFDSRKEAILFLDKAKKYNSDAWIRIR